MFRVQLRRRRGDFHGAKKPSKAENNPRFLHRPRRNPRSLAREMLLVEQSDGCHDTVNDVLGQFDLRCPEEGIADNQNGLLADFYDLDRLVEFSLQVLRDPEGHRHLGKAGMTLIREKYALDQTLSQLVDLFQTAVNGN